MRNLGTRFAIAALVVLPTCATAGSWEYRDPTEDEGGMGVRSATLESDDDLQFDFPHQGDDRATLAIRETRSDGPQVLFSVRNGRIICGFRGQCVVMVRFDDDRWERFSASATAETGTAALLFDDRRRFVEMAGKSRKFLVSFTLEHRGTRIMEFTSPTPLTWGSGPKP